MSGNRHIMDKINSGEINPEILENHNKYKNRSRFAKFYNMNSVRSRFVREDTFYSTYYANEMTNGLYDGKQVDPKMLSDIFLLLDHDFEKVAVDRLKQYTEYFINGQVNKLTGLNLLEFLNMTEKEAHAVMEVVDGYNRKQYQEHKAAEAEMKKEK